MEFIVTSLEHENPREAYSFDLTYPEDPRDEAITFGGTKVVISWMSYSRAARLLAFVGTTFSVNLPRLCTFNFITRTLVLVLTSQQWFVMQ